MGYNGYAILTAFSREEQPVPFAQLTIGTGRGDAVKQQLIENVTKAITETLGPLRQPVWVIIHETPLTQWGVDGVPVKPPDA
jgi:4-oxalocrotonate tautomerase family enzyme